jgi:hypothetical protein
MIEPIERKGALAIFGSPWPPSHGHGGPFLAGHASGNLLAEPASNFEQVSVESVLQLERRASCRRPSA